jgi:hypothetical protein
MRPAGFSLDSQVVLHFLHAGDFFGTVLGATFRFPIADKSGQRYFAVSDRHFNVLGIDIIVVHERLVHILSNPFVGTLISPRAATAEAATAPLHLPLARSFPEMFALAKFVSRARHLARTAVRHAVRNVVTVIHCFVRHPSLSLRKVTTFVAAVLSAVRFLLSIVSLSRLTSPGELAFVLFEVLICEPFPTSSVGHRLSAFVAS